MLYRRKVILALLEALGGEVPPTDFQKYLFLLSQIQEQPSFEFVPYRFGCFSFSSYVDRRVMAASGILSGSEKWELTKKTGHLQQVSESDKNAIRVLIEKFGALKGNDLIRYVYLTFPYYATKSEIASERLSKEEYQLVMEALPENETPSLFTIGYEGRSPEGFLNELLRRQVNVLCDVRRNAVSMKYGFSAKTLKTHCEDVGIHYAHIPALGIASEKRKSLSTKIEFDRLFAEYEKEVLGKTDALDELLKIINKYNRVALTCFEREPRSCHRHTLVSALKQYVDNLPEVVHI